MLKIKQKDEHPQIAQLVERLAEALPKNQGKAVSDFSQLYYSATPAQELDSRKIDDLYGATLACWSFIQNCKGEGKIRAFNPDFEEHGWQSTHTIIEIIHKDIPFLVDSVRMELNRREMSIHFINHAVLPVSRNKKGDLDLKDCFSDQSDRQEAVIYIEVDRHSDDKVLADLNKQLQQIVDEICLVVEDFETFKERSSEVMGWIRESEGPATKAQTLSLIHI